MKAITWQQLGLTAYVVLTVAVPFLVLLFDLWLDLTGRMMITDYCRAHPWAAWLIVAVTGFGLIGLSVHFMAPVLVHAE